MSIGAGETVALIVEREVSPYGYFLSDGSQDILLPYYEKEGDIHIGERIDVFLFHDAKDRLTATMKQPYLQLGQIGLLRIADIHPKLGCFLDMGLSRHLLLPKTEFAKDDKSQVDDQVYVKLTRDKQGRMLAQLAGERELEPLVFAAPEHWKNTWVHCIVYRNIDSGSFVVCDGGVIGFGVLGFIHASERFGVPRIGQKLKGRVTFIREDGRVNLSLRQVKESGREEDAERIIRFMSERTGRSMPYSDATPPDIIMEKFGISKAAFKRALGKLMKEGHIRQDGGWTFLKGRDSE